MRKLLLLIALPWKLIAHQSKHISPEAFDKDATVIRSTIVIVQATGHTAHYIRSAIAPSDTERLEQLQRKELLTILKVEEQLNQCLLANRSAPLEDSELPSQCREAAELFAIVAGYEALNSIKKEFNAARNEVIELQEEPAPQGMSTSTKVLIGCTVVAAGGVVFVVAAPVLLPGTAIAAKAIAIKTAAGSAIGYVTTANVHHIATTAAGGALSLAKDTKETTIQATKAAAHDFTSLSFSDQIIVTARIIEAVERTAQQTRPYLYQTEAEELQHLLKLRAQQASLKERIRQAHRNSP